MEPTAFVVPPVSDRKPLRCLLCERRGIYFTHTVLIIALACFALAFLASGAYANDRRPIQGTAKIVSWFTERDGYATVVLVNAILEHEPVTLKCSTTLDPGAYTGDRSDDRVWFHVRDLHNHEHEEKCSILRRSWTRPVR